MIENDFDFPSLLYCQVYVSYKDNVRILNPEVEISFFILVQLAIESFITFNRVVTLASLMTTLRVKGTILSGF